MNIMWNILKIARRRQQDERGVEPLDHPEIARMTLAELADLPMPIYTKENCTGSVRII